MKSALYYLSCTLSFMSPSLMGMEGQPDPLRTSTQSTNQSSTEYTDGTKGPLLLHPDPAITLAKLEKIEHALKEKGKTLKKDPSAQDFFIILPERASRYEKLVVTVTSTIKKKPVLALISCLLALHNSLCAIHEAEVERREDAPPYFTAALSLLNDAKGQCEKEQPALVKELQSGFGQQTQQIIMAAITQYANYREVILANGENEESLGSAVSHSSPKLHASVMHESLLELLEECIPIKEQNKEAARCCTELVEILLEIAERCPLLLDLRSMTDADLRTNPALMLLYETKTAQLTSAYNAQWADAAANPKVQFALLKQLITQNAILARETNSLIDKMITVVQTCSAITVHDVAKLDTVVSDQQLIPLIINKIDEEQVSHDVKEIAHQLQAINQLQGILEKFRLGGKTAQCLQPLVAKRTQQIEAFLLLLKSGRSLMDDAVKHPAAILSIPELHLKNILLPLTTQYNKITDSHGFELLLALFGRALFLIDLIERLPKTDLLDSLQKDTLIELLRTEGALEEKKIAFELKKSSELAEAKKELDEIAAAIKLLVEKAPELISMGLLSVPSLKGNKMVLLLLARKLLSAPDDGTDRHTQAERLSYHIAELGKAIGLSSQTRFALAQKHASKKTKSLHKLELAQQTVELLSPELQQIEREYTEIMDQLAKICLNHATLIHKLNETTEVLTEEELHAKLDDIEATCKQAAPVAAHQIQKLRAWQGNIRELLNCGPLINAESPHECTVFALLVNAYMDTIRKQLDQKRSPVAEARQLIELHTLRIANYERCLQEYDAARQQAEADRQEIAAALHAIHAQFPAAVSPELLRDYPLPQNSSWWTYSPFTLCAVM